MSDKDIDLMQIIVKHVQRIKNDPRKNHVVEDAKAIWDDLFKVLRQTKPVPVENNFGCISDHTNSPLPWRMDETGTAIIDSNGSVIAVCMKDDQLGNVLPASMNAAFIIGNTRRDIK